ARGLRPPSRPRPRPARARPPCTRPPRRPRLPGAVLRLLSPRRAQCRRRHARRHRGAGPARPRPLGPQHLPAARRAPVAKCREADRGAFERLTRRGSPPGLVAAVHARLLAWPAGVAARGKRFGPRARAARSAARGDVTTWSPEAPAVEPSEQAFPGARR